MSMSIAIMRNSRCRHAVKGVEQPDTVSDISTVKGVEEEPDTVSDTSTVEEVKEEPYTVPDTPHQQSSPKLPSNTATHITTKDEPATPAKREIKDEPDAIPPHSCAKSVPALSISEVKEEPKTVLDVPHQQYSWKIPSKIPSNKSSRPSPSMFQSNTFVLGEPITAEFANTFESIVNSNLYRYYENPVKDDWDASEVLRLLGPNTFDWSPDPVDRKEDSRESGIDWRQLDWRHRPSSNKNDRRRGGG